MSAAEPAPRDYEVTSLLAHGAHGPVYAARSRLTGHEVALQQVDPEIADLPGFAARLTAVGRQAASVQHPNLVGTYDLVTGPDGLLVVMERVTGPSLRRLATTSPLAPADVLAAADDVLGALEALHARGLVHGDVTPDRVLVTTSGAARLANVAVCSALAGLPPTPALPRSPYASPERAAGAPLDARTDLYAVAAMTHELLTGELPESDAAVGPQALPAVATVLQRALATEPLHRFATATELRAALVGSAEASLGPAWRLSSELGDLAAAALRTPAEDPQAPPAVAAASPPPAGRLPGFSVPPPPGSTVMGGATPPPAVARVPSEVPAGYLPPKDRRTVAAPAMATAPRRRRRRLWLVLAALLVLVAAGAAVAIALALRPSSTSGTGASSAPLTVGSDVRLTVTPPSGGCNTTFHFVATGSLHGVGTLVYRWDRSDGQTTGDMSVQVTSQDGSFELTHDWSIQGSQTLQGTITFRIVRPTVRVVNQPVTYTCP